MLFGTFNIYQALKLLTKIDTSNFVCYQFLMVFAMSKAHKGKFFCNILRYDNHHILEN